MIADRCEINRQIRADNKMLQELKAKVAKLAEAVEKSIPIIAETLEVIRNHMIFTQYHLLHNEMQKEVIHRAWELEYQRKQEMRRNQLARTKKMSYDMEL